MTRFLLLIAVLTLSAFPLAQATTSPEALLKAAIQREKIEANHAAALTQYSVIVEKFPDSAVVPEALLGMATCYEHLGKPVEAAGVYQRIVTRYARSAAASTARSKLAATEQKSTELVLRKVTEGTGGLAVSTDGKFVSLTDWDTGDLAVRDLASGKTKRITGNGKWNDSFTDTSFPSPDSRQIAYDWWNHDRDRYELRVIGRDGGQPRVAYSNEDNRFEMLIGWLPPGKEALVLLKDSAIKGKHDIVAVTVASGQPRVVTAIGDGATDFSISPDGKWIAFSRRPENSSEYDLFVLSLETGAESLLAHHGANDHALSWTPRGDGLLFCSDRNSSFGIWGVPVVGGKAVGEPTSIRPDTGRVFPLGFTQTGEFYYATSFRADRVVIATIDPATGKQTHQPRRVEGRYATGASQPAWSPDGSQLAYSQITVALTSSLQPASAQGRGMGRKLEVHAISTGETRLLTVDMVNFQNPAWTPDGRAVIVQGNVGTGRQGLFRLDVANGAVTPISVRTGAETTGELNRSMPAVSPDGRSVYFKGVTAGGPAPSPDHQGIYVRELASGVESRIFEGQVENFALSPDGAWLAITQQRKSMNFQPMVVPVAGGAPRQLAAEGVIWTRGTVAWSADGRSLLVVRDADADRAREVWQMPVDGGAPRNTGILVTGNITRIAVHPDGRRLALSLAVTDTELWAMRNLPPLRK